jgi:hypothetical protein
MAEKNKTLGLQLLEKFNPDEKGHECRETVLEYIQDRFGPELDKVIKEHKKFADKYYIWIVKQDLAPMGPDVKKINIVVRKTKPIPKYETMLFSYSNKSNDLRLEWVLPTEELSETIANNKKDFDFFLVKSVLCYDPKNKYKHIDI